ncbi:apolipoprotein N-acyltransferase [Glaciecola siphonariae]|uniref:Apolipoprotein N-acyltransferase n=1 Tax=Glaciecola siphonariae TaxID=521012 RepID=A0ABV9LV32_9ALTE
MLLGGVLTFSYAPFGQWWLPFVVLPLWLTLVAKHGESAFKTGWWFGLGFFGAGISWVHVSIATFGGVPLVVSVFLMLVLCSYLALFPAVFSRILKQYFPIALWPLAAPGLWLASEWLRANLLTGFPWLSVGYSQTNSPLQSLFPLIGEIGVSALMLMFAALIASSVVLKTKQSIFSSLTVTLVLCVTVFIAKQYVWVMETGETRTAALVQGNIEQSIRWEPEQDRPIMEKYLALSEQAWGADIVIWPEAAIPRLEVLATGFLSDLDRSATSHNSALITGIVDVNLENDQAFNKLIALGLDTPTDNTSVYRYPSKNVFKKHHLLPIGEFVPFEALLRPLAPIFDLPMSSFSRGDYVQDNLMAKGILLAPAICFEIAFPSQILANIRPETDAIVTVSNDAWFGDSHGPHQHLQIARARAIEFGRPVLRATNTGLTAAYDHQGQILGRLAQFEDGVLQVEFPLVEGSTPYYRFGNAPMMLLGGLGISLALSMRFKKKF